MEGQYLKRRMGERQRFRDPMRQMGGSNIERLLQRVLRSPYRD
jgi:hypothetical protein